ncbi:hypothetical protein H0G86_004249 [Trichoderma simmonsii]|uniref:Uncharacterized protein n=1 Tax=Trichoderma simmonsii TaxID=1491479 RepID=A0A8G0LA61_9HYPO|nr:hypothetical protein H0G86_004249 [Trichoderma simmonsii]
MVQLTWPYKERQTENGSWEKQTRILPPLVPPPLLVGLCLSCVSVPLSLVLSCLVCVCVSVPASFTSIASVHPCITICPSLGVTFNLLPTNTGSSPPKLAALSHAIRPGHS